ncbi:MAG: Gfo/Idh/MocA family protein [Bacillota bacterium]
MKKLRVGIIGTGMAFERLHYPAYQEMPDKYQIVAVCDEDRAKASRWAGRLGIDSNRVYSDYREMCKRDDIDCYDIMVPIEKNYTVTEEVASIARKPIICEKPLAPNKEQAFAHRELPKKYGIPIMIAENYRYNEETNMIRDMVKTKKIGDIVYFIQNRVYAFPIDMHKNSFAATEWRQRPDYPGGTILDTTVHDLAALRHILGPIDRLQAFGVPQDDDFSPYAVVNVNIRFKSGVTGNFSFYCSGVEMQRPLVGLRMFGTSGMIYLEERDCGIINVAHNDGRSEQVPFRTQRGFYNELLNFYNAAIGKEPIFVTPEMEFGDAMTVFAILDSIREGRIVEVDRYDDFDPAYAGGEQQYDNRQWIQQR